MRGFSPTRAKAWLRPAAYTVGRLAGDCGTCTRVVDCVEEAPQCVEGFVGRGEDVSLAAFGMFKQPIAPRAAVGLVGLFMHAEIGKRFGCIHSVKLAESRDLRG